jgi:hypothetical protein
MNSIATSNCDSYSRTTCERRQHCTYTTRNGCELIPNTTFMQAVCGKCIQEFNHLKYSRPENVEGTVRYQSLICSKAPSGAYCLPLLYTGLSDENFNNATLAGLCGSNDKAVCYNQITLGAAAYARIDLQKQYRSCVRSWSNSSSAIDTYCLPALLTGELSLRQAEVMLAFICMQNANNDYCVAKLFDVIGNQCLYLPQFTGSCTSCQANLSATFTSAGCCLGAIQEFLGGVPSYDGITIPTTGRSEGKTTFPPRARVATAITTAPVTLAANEELIAEVSAEGLPQLSRVCNLPDLNASLYKKCKIAVGTAKKSLKVAIRYAAIAANNELREKVRASLKADLAIKCGVATSAIVNDSIVEDASVKVAASASRRMDILQATSQTTGIRYDFTLKAPPATVTAASQNFDTAVASNNLVLPSTVATVSSECSTTCTNGNAASINDVGAANSSAATFYTTVLVVLVFAMSLLA